MDPQHELFNIQVNEDGKRSIVQIYKLTKFLFWFSISVDLLMWFQAFRHYLHFRDISEKSKPFLYWEIRIYCVYLIIISLFSVLQSFYFLQFTRKARESVRLNESTGFNSSLPWLYRSLRFGVFVITMNALYFLYLNIWNGWG